MRRSVGEAARRDGVVECVQLVDARVPSGFGRGEADLRDPMENVGRDLVPVAIDDDPVEISSDRLTQEVFGLAPLTRDHELVVSDEGVGFLVRHVFLRVGPDCLIRSFLFRGKR